MGKLTSGISIPVRGRRKLGEGPTSDKRMGYRISLVVKRRGGSSGLQIAKDVAIGSRNGYGLDAIALEQNEGRLGVIKGWAEGDGGRRQRIGMDLTSQGAYHQLVFCQLLLPQSATSNGCGQR
ncbi:hypothetical protein GOBAR_DD02496 [Gossypium barbadense]|nr:hypothetical protein GOBAR_DD02496 [Gossypium barbadense]